MSELPSTSIQTDSEETRYYQELEKHINSLSMKFREKSVIKQNSYNDIVTCLLSPKGKPLGNFSAKFMYWVKQHFTLMKIAGADMACCIKSKKNICIYETYYSVIHEAHSSISHGGRDKTLFELNSHYSWIPRFAVEIYLKQCITCQTRKPLKQHVVNKPIISLGVMTRLQIDLIDMRTRPDILNPDVTYNWILHCIDHFSKFTWSFDLKRKSADEVAIKLRELIFIFGPPRILHSDNGREFVAGVIHELKELFPDMIFIRGRPRHPQSQGCIERANGVLCDALGKWMATTKSSHWSEGLLPVVYGINTRLSSVTKTTPYQVMFGQEPRSNSEFWRLVQKEEILDEEDLPMPVANDNIVQDKEDDFNDCADIIEDDIIQLVQQISDDVAADILVNQSSTHPPLIEKPSTTHDAIRKIATDNYLSVANKKMMTYQQSVIDETEGFNVNDCVGIKIHSSDRTNTDAKLLPCLIVEKNMKDNIPVFKLVCQFGKLENNYALEHLVDLKMACPQELKQIVIDDLKEITLIEACKLFVRGSLTGHTCDCKGKCVTRQCPCKKVGVYCSTKCHSKRAGCANMGD
ncbi:unnamed protein product [Rotaria magnacalcarata]|uniref:Integrase catalytic domain-containing protein n=1 Tax=Rotaria magnacalcarata TaxID=392030 RepID=A0A816WF00_9BILA|nr:unnamed protein product [Rotaria magnacalcarata]CAF4084257.1 unnamed protein product [Rotaria magnacalcarata]